MTPNPEPEPERAEKWELSVPLVLLGWLLVLLGCLIAVFGLVAATTGCAAKKPIVTHSVDLEVPAAHVILRDCDVQAGPPKCRGRFTVRYKAGTETVVVRKK